MFGRGGGGVSFCFVLFCRTSENVPPLISTYQVLFNNTHNNDYECIEQRTFNTTVPYLTFCVLDFLCTWTFCVLDFLCTWTFCVLDFLCT